MQNVSDIIDGLGGTTEVARRLGIVPQAVANMKARGSIPAEYWKPLLVVAEERGKHEVTLELLADVAVKPRQFSKAGAA